MIILPKDLPKKNTLFGIPTLDLQQMNARSELEQNHLIKQDGNKNTLNTMYPPKISCIRSKLGQILAQA
jgi:hypothetical protein